MKVSYKSDYALKAVLDLAIQYNSGLVSSRDMAVRIDAPVKFLEKVLANLVKGGFIESKRGSEGGYRLAKEPKQISVGDIVRLVEGTIEPIACVNPGYADCKERHTCVFRTIWAKAHKATSDIVDNITFEDLVNDINSQSEFFDYSI